jgi:hypothetical protein
MLGMEVESGFADEVVDRFHRFGGIEGQALAAQKQQAVARNACTAASPLPYVLQSPRATNTTFGR